MPISIVNRYYLEAVICIGCLLLSIESARSYIYDMYKHNKYGPFARAFSAVLLIGVIIMSGIVTAPVKNMRIILDAPNVIFDNYREFSGVIKWSDTAFSPHYDYRSYEIDKYHIENIAKYENRDVYLLCTEDPGELWNTHVTVRYYPLSHIGCITKIDKGKEKLVFSRKYTDRTAELALYVTLNALYLLLGVWNYYFNGFEKVVDKKDHFIRVKSDDGNVFKRLGKYFFGAISLILLTHISMLFVTKPVPETAMLTVYAVVFIYMIKAYLKTRDCLSICRDKPIMRHYHGKEILEEFPCKIDRVDDDGFCVKDINDKSKEKIVYEISYKDKKMQLDNESICYGFETVDALYKKLLESKHEKPGVKKRYYL